MSDARELLDEIDNRAMGDIICDPRILDGFEAMLEALRAVLDKHQPFTDDGLTYCGWDKHGGCGHAWPCPDVQAITSALAGDPQ